jgi:hypothetical protein
MAMGGTLVRDGFAGVAMGVDVDGSVVVAMSVKMDPVAPQPPQHMRAETDQHDPDRGLDRARKIVGDRLTERQRSAGKNKERQRMAEPPGQAVLDDIGDVFTPRGDRGNRGYVIGFQRVLHAQQKAQPQYCKHRSPFMTVPDTTAGPERHLSLSGGKLERKSGLGYAEPVSPDGAAFQVARPEILFVAGGTKGDAEAPFVMHGEV